MELRPGQPYALAVREADKRRILARYGGIGCFDAAVNVELRFTTRAGVVDLLYRIHEGQPYLLGELEFREDDRTKDNVIRGEAILAELILPRSD